MSPKLPTLCAVAALIAGVTACGTLGKHYNDEEESPPSSSFAEAFQTTAVLVDSIPSGAIIRLNGIKIGAGPVLARPVVEDNGTLANDTVFSADYSTFVLARGSTEIITTTYRGGDSPPRRLLLARAADGGVQAMGWALPKIR